MQELVFFLTVMPPDAREIIRLQLESDRAFVGAVSTMNAVVLLRVAKQPLHVMPDFVGDHISAREFTWRVQLLLQQFEERQVEVNLAVARTIKRPHRGFARTASGLG